MVIEQGDEADHDSEREAIGSQHPYCLAVESVIWIIPVRVRSTPDDTQRPVGHCD